MYEKEFDKRVSSDKKGHFEILSQWIYSILLIYYYYYYIINY